MSDQQAKFFEKLNQRSGRNKTSKRSTVGSEANRPKAETQQALPGMDDIAVESKPGRNKRKSGDSDGYGEVIEIQYQRTLDSLDQCDRERFVRLTGG